MIFSDYMRNSIKIIKIDEEDNNFDGNPDIFHISLSYVPENRNGPTNIQMFILFDYLLDV